MPFLSCAWPWENSSSGLRNNITCQNFLQYDQLEQYVPRYLVYSLIWSFSGDGKMKSRAEMGNFIRSITTIPLPSGNIPIIDYEVNCRTVAAVLHCVANAQSACRYTKLYI